MSIGNAVVLVGFGGFGNPAFKEACKSIGDVVKNSSNYELLSFVHFDDPHNPLWTLRLTTGEWVDADKESVATRLVSLPPLAKITAKWQNVLREISAALEDTLVSIVVDGEVQVALGGNIF